MYRIIINDPGKLFFVNNIEIRTPTIFKICDKDLIRIKNKIRLEQIINYKIEKCENKRDSCCS